MRLWNIQCTDPHCWWLAGCFIGCTVCAICGLTFAVLGLRVLMIIFLAGPMVIPMIGCVIIIFKVYIPRCINGNYTPNNLRQQQEPNVVVNEEAHARIISPNQPTLLPIQIPNISPEYIPGTGIGQIMLNTITRDGRILVNPTPTRRPTRMGMRVGLRPQSIDMLPKFRYAKQGENEDEDLQCSICLGEFEEGEEVKKLPPCLHLFHTDCIDRWLRRSYTCPICRNIVMRNYPGEIVIAVQ